MTISATYGYTWVDIIIDDSTIPDSYNIYRDAVLIGNIRGVDKVFEDYDLAPGEEYSYEVKPVIGEVEQVGDSVIVTTDTPLVTGHRYATEQDALRIKNANVGDGIIDGHNSTIEGRYSIENNQYKGFQFELGPGQKLLIKGGTYEHIWFNLPGIIGTKKDPVVITNYEGQVRLIFDPDTTSPKKDRLFIQGSKNFKVTGKYDPVKKTGDPRFKGHDGPWGWSFLADSYGFLMDNAWKTKTYACFKGDQTYFEVEYTESRNGGFAGFSLKNDDPADPTIPMDINIHDNYIHDLHSEAFYTGKNVTECAQHNIIGRIWNNLMTRSGTESLQVSNIANKFAIYNNTIISAAVDWKSPFQNFQNKGNQLGMKQGVFDYYGNMNYGTGMANGDVSVVGNACYPGTVDKPVTFKNNTFAFARERSWYIFNNTGDRTDNTTPLIFDDNVWHMTDNQAGEMYFNDQADTNDILNNQRDGGVYVINNKYTLSKPFLTGKSVEENTNNTQISWVQPEFEGSGFHADLDPRAIEIWKYKIGIEPAFNADTITYMSTPFDLVGTHNLLDIEEDEVLSVVEFPKRLGVDYWDNPAFIGMELRLADKANEYTHFVIVTLKGVNLVNKTITVSAPSKIVADSTPVTVQVDRAKAYVTYEYNAVNPDLSDIVTVDSKFYQYIWSGEPHVPNGVNPEDDVNNGDGTTGTYWKLLTWERPDGTISYFPEDNWKVKAGTYYALRNQGIGYSSYDWTEDEEPKGPGKNPLRLRKQKMLDLVVKNWFMSPASSVPPPVSNFIIEYVDGIVLYWDSYEGAVQYDIWKSTDGVNFILVHYIPEEEFFGFWLDQEEEPGTYYYKVRVKLEGDIYSKWSEVVEIELEGEPVNRGTVTNVTYSSVYGSGQNFGYKQYVPADYDGNTATPLVIWLHGLGERSQSNGNPQFSRLELYGPFKEYKDFEADYPFFMIAPQQPTDVDGKYTGRSSWDVEIIEESLNHFKAQGYNIDLDRVYITGQSMGGGGVLSYINSAYGNETIAAALPIASTLPQGTGIACNIKHIPIWIFHAENDPTVPSSNSKNLYTAIKACTPAPDVEPKITIFNLSSHTGWNQVYKNTGATLTDYADNSPFPDGTTWEQWLLQYSLQTEVSPAQKELVTFSSSTFPSETCKYYKYLPEGYDEAANESLYCFIVLHGLGEFRDKISGTEADKDAGIWQNGPAKHIYNNDDLDTIGIAPHVFICPQQPYGTNFNNTIPSDRWNFNYLAEIYNIAIGLEKVDPNKIIITGLSMGGMAAQRYASLNPEKIYKCLVVAPNWLNAVDEVFAHQVPLWVIHGQNDTTGGGFGVGTTRTKIRDINALDPTYPPKFTCPTGVGHNAWDKTYNGVGWSVEELTADPNGGAGVDPIGNPDHNPYVWATTGDKTNIIA